MNTVTSILAIKEMENTESFWLSNTTSKLMNFHKEKHLHEIHSKSALVQPPHATSILKSTNSVDNDA